jgi:hypothetical protein
MDWAARIDGVFRRFGPARAELFLIAAFTIAFLYRDVRAVQTLTASQPLGVDFAALWAGARVDPSRLYDFASVTAEQAWLHTVNVRPFVYPPSALLFLKPFGLLPFPVAYGLFTAASAAFFLWAAHRIGARSMILLLAATPLILVAVAGQTTFLIGGLVMTALSVRRRPWLAGALFAVTGMIKPQMLVLLPLALAVEGDWRTFRATGVVAALIGLASLALGVSWFAWFEALTRFSDLIARDQSLLDTTMTPTLWLGPASYLITIPIALAGVCLAFRSDSVGERVLALLGGALLVSPYAMNYSIAVLVPAMLALRKPFFYGLPFWLAIFFKPSSPIALGVAMAVLLLVHADDIARLARCAVAKESKPQEA